MSEISDSDNPTRSSEKLAQIEGEVAALKATLSREKPWYKEASTLVSSLAFIFSLGTTVVSYIRSGQQDVHAARAELQSYIEKLSSLPREYYQLQKDFQGNPQALVDLSGTMNGQLIFFSRRASEVIKQIPNQVSSTEATFVAAALFQTGTYTEGGKLAQLAIDKAKNYNDEIAADRNYGRYLLYQGRFSDGRMKLQSALEIFSKYAENNEDVKNVSAFETEIWWAQSEAAAHQTNEVRGHMSNAAVYLSKIPLGPVKDQYTQRLALLQATPGGSGTMVGLNTPQASGSVVEIDKLQPSSK
ncbi:MAG TPA: hypothetical protein VGD78_20815 [Chthoniobacterales bacterium]